MNSRSVLLSAFFQRAKTGERTEVNKSAGFLYSLHIPVSPSRPCLSVSSGVNFLTVSMLTHPSEMNSLLVLDLSLRSTFSSFNLRNVTPCYHAGLIQQAAQDRDVI